MHKDYVDSWLTFSNEDRNRAIDNMMAEIVADDLTPLDATVHIMQEHNEEPGQRGGYLLYNPLQPHISSRRRAQYPSVGFLAIAAGHKISRDPLIVETLLQELEYARRERLNPDGGRLF